MPKKNATATTQNRYESPAKTAPTTNPTTQLVTVARNPIPNRASIVCAPNTKPKRNPQIGSRTRKSLYPLSKTTSPNPRATNPAHSSSNVDGIYASSYQNMVDGGLRSPAGGPSAM